jgi:predicted lipoprotein
MLVNYADNYILPGYDVIVTSLTTLKSKVEAFTATPNTTTLSELRMQLHSSYERWQQVDMLEFGPAENVSLRMYMNTYPVTTSKVEANITNGGYDLEQFGNKDAQGFPAVDYLVNAKSEDSTLEMFTTGSNAAQRKAYLAAITNKMLDKVKGVKQEWGTYRNTFVEATGTDVNSSLSKMVNAFVLYYERYLRSGKVGLPAGVMTGTAKPELVESYYAPQMSAHYAVTALMAVTSFYEGRSFLMQTAGTSSMKDYLKTIGTKDDNGQLISDLITKELAEAEAKMKAMKAPLKTAVVSERATVLAAYDELQQVVPLLKVDMVSAFGISITYTDNDGD